jgi:hypothetical protein
MKITSELRVVIKDLAVWEKLQGVYLEYLLNQGPKIKIEEIRTANADKIIEVVVNFGSDPGRPTTKRRVSFEVGTPLHTCANRFLSSVVSGSESGIEIERFYATPKSGIEIYFRFKHFDSFRSREDIEALFIQE